MPRKHINLKITAQQFQLSVLDPFFHRSYNQVWLPLERTPVLTAGDQWKATDLPFNLTRAMSQAVLACSSLSKKIALGTYPEITSLIAHISRHDVTFMLELDNKDIENDVLLRFCWDKNSQLLQPDNFSALGKLGVSTSCQQRLKNDLTQCAFGRFGLVARCLRLMATKPFTGQHQDNHFSTQTA